jgi:hypothetical protein
MEDTMPLALMLLAACTGDEPIGKETDSGLPAEEDTDSPAEDTGTAEDPGFVPAHFNVSGVFGIDSEAGTLHSYFVEGQEYPPWVAINIYTEGFAEACLVLYSMADPEDVALETWVWEDATEAAAGQVMNHTGFMLPAAASISYSDGCADWNASEYGELADVVVPHAWGVGIGDIRTDVQETLSDSEDLDPFLADRIEAGELLGGSWSADLWEPAIWASHAATGSPTDDWTLEVDEEGQALQHFSHEDIQTADGLPSGVYVLRSIWGWGYMEFFGG